MELALGGRLRSPEPTAINGATLSSRRDRNAV